MTRRFYLVRHGETPMNAAHLLQGIRNSPLTPKGEAAALTLGKLLQDVSFDSAFSSDRLRAEQTARLILSLQKTPPPLQIITSLREYYFGSLEGRSNQTVFLKTIQHYGFKQALKAWRGSARFEGLVRSLYRADETNQAEHPDALKQRGQLALQQMIAKSSDDSNILVVSHGLFLSALIAQLNAAALPLRLLSNTSVTRLDESGGVLTLLGVNLSKRSDILS